MSGGHAVLEAAQAVVPSIASGIRVRSAVFAGRDFVSVLFGRLASIGRTHGGGSGGRFATRPEDARRTGHRPVSGRADGSSAIISFS
jgi:hypothetical protein